LKVILNALPPARTDTPSAALSVLKAFLAHHHIEPSIIYWNLLLDRLLPPFERDTDATHFDLLPYLYLIADEYQDEIAKGKTNAVMKAKLPLRDKLNDNSDYFVRTKGLLEATVAGELSKYPASEPLLFGIPCKFEQWIAGVVIARLVKRRFPLARIVAGGLRNQDKAEALMRVCADFDFAIWGEGEYPLLELCQAIAGKTEDFNSVPRLIYRKKDSLRRSTPEVSRTYDMNGRIFPDYDDYFRYREASPKKNIPAILPLESSRGCIWSSCRFCVYPDGSENRKKDPGVLIEEIHHLLGRYDTPYFAFMDNDIVANDHKRLETILDDLISIKRTRNIQLIAEVIPKHFTPELMQKLFRAGLGRVHFGYESLSDRLLEKMRKRNSFSDNIFFVKFAHKYKIKLPSANIICGAVGEEDYDILESIDNLHFLRFYFDKHLFVHNLIPLQVAKHSAFYGMLEKEELKKWDGNTVFHLLPGKMLDGVDRFSLFDFSAKPGLLWEMFAKINGFYYDHRYSYSISMEDKTVSMEDKTVVYREFFDGELSTSFALTRLECRILRETNSAIMALDDLIAALGKGMDNELDGGAVRAALNHLKQKHLVYFDGDHRSIISVVDAAQIAGLPSPGNGFI
jgi:radical SAM superfamily enzyme YgiQ (UPF0313 family)